MGGNTAVGDRRIESRASFTAQTRAARRAAETMQPSGRRILDDPHSRHFVQNPFLRSCLIHPVVARSFIGLLNYVWGAASHIFTVLRVRYSDDILDAAMKTGIDQIVVLGAGFDTIALRNSHIQARYSVTDTRATRNPAELAQRQTQAQVFSADLRTRAGHLATVDGEVTTNLTNAAAGIGNTQFQEQPLTDPDDTIIGDPTHPVKPVDNDPQPPPSPPLCLPTGGRCSSSSTSRQRSCSNKDSKSKTYRASWPSNTTRPGKGSA